MRRGYLLGLVALLVAGVVATALIVSSGVIDVAATASNPLDPLLAYASLQSIRHHAPAEKNRLADDPAALKVGLEHYREMCITCHAGPGVEAEEFAAGLHPAAPDLASAEVQSFTDGMLYRTIAKGIGSTGMPAFETTHSPDKIWSIVAFVRQLPKLTAEQKKELAEKPRGEDEGEHDEEHDKDKAEAPAKAAEGATEAKAADNKGPAHSVSMVGFKFAPAKLEVHVGDTVEWINRDFVAHTATADDKSFDTGKLDANASKRLTMTKAGTFPYTCHYHSGMKGTLVVQ